MLNSRKGNAPSWQNWRRTSFKRVFGSREVGLADFEVDDLLALGFEFLGASQYGIGPLRLEMGNAVGEWAGIWHGIPSEILIFRTCPDCTHKPNNQKQPGGIRLK